MLYFAHSLPPDTVNPNEDKKNPLPFVQWIFVSPILCVLCVLIDFAVQDQLNHRRQIARHLSCRTWDFPPHDKFHYSIKIAERQSS